MANDPRAWLAEVQERAEKDQACYRCRLTKREHQAGYSASRCTFIASPHTDPDKAAMAAALTAVLDLLDNVDDTVVTQADGVHVPVYLVRQTITEYLPRGMYEHQVHADD